MDGRKKASAYFLVSFFSLKTLVLKQRHQTPAAKKQQQQQSRLLSTTQNSFAPSRFCRVSTNKVGKRKGSNTKASSRLDEEKKVFVDPIEAKGLFFHAFWRARRGVFSSFKIRQSLDHTSNRCRKKKKRGVQIKKKKKKKKKTTVITTTKKRTHRRRGLGVAQKPRCWRCWRTSSFLMIVVLVERRLLPAKGGSLVS